MKKQTKKTAGKQEVAQKKKRGGEESVCCDKWEPGVPCSTLRVGATKPPAHPKICGDGSVRE
ncbi:hypothetical protein EB008_00425 [bacterium]|nr:hypothetical protein [bacterium]